MKYQERELILAQVTSLPVKTNQIEDVIFSPKLLSIGIFLIALVWINLSGKDNKKNKLGTAFWGGAKEKAVARKKGISQIQNSTRNNVCLYINTPKKLIREREKDWKSNNYRNPVQAKKSNASTFYIPDCQRGTAVIGAAGSGKTFSVIDPMIRSAADQGFPILLYDFKYAAQAKRIAAYAVARGYQIKVFAPGFKESATINPLDFIRDEDDAVAAGQMAATINKNSSEGDGKGDKFFEDAGNSLVEGIFLLTKAIPKLLAKWRPADYAEADGITPNEKAKSYCDLITAQQLLSLPKIANRLIAAKEAGTIGNWTSVPLTQVMQSADAEKTVSGIVSTALRTFTKFLKKDFIPSFIGKTNVSLDMDGKQLLIFGLDRNNRSIVGPLLATILHMTVTRNVTRQEPRKDPLCTFLDELPTLYLPSLVEWLAENREDGFVGVLGLQNQGQLEKRYGKETAQIILGNCSTKFIFNPQENASAESFSKLLGDTEITYTTKSSSTAKGGGSRSTSKNKQAKPLMPPAEFNQLGTGRCVFLNPAYKRKERSYIPLIQDMKICPAEIAWQQWSESNWKPIQDYLALSQKDNLLNQSNVNAILDRAIDRRLSIVKGFFPEPKKQEKK